MKLQKMFLLLIPLILWGCNNADQGSNPQISNGSLKINLASSTVLVNDSLKLSIQYLSSSGQSVSGGSVTWHSTNTSVAVVSPSGYLTGIAQGQTDIMASADGFDDDSLHISVVNDLNSVASVVISGITNDLATGQTLQLIAKAYNISGTELNVPSFNWSSTDQSVLTVDASGLVTAVAKGTANITAASGSITSPPFSLNIAGPNRTGKFIKNPEQDHVISGDVTLEENKDGTLTMQFSSNFSSSGGPDIRVYLADATSLSGNIYEAGPLKSISGAQTYSIPSSVKLNTYDYVLIHCFPFNITFGWAKLN